MPRSAEATSGGRSRAGGTALRQIGIIKKCGVDEFVAAAQSEFSNDFQALAGTYLNDGAPATFADWLAEWRSVVRIIDMEEG